ncbi:MAG: NAD(P)/FAD-dependent oxidoreductase [Actinobacteria bacterium]|nr:NAD(P)/FAD-dependent oxidoreductase [Actinomycetota bacterium]
MAVAGGACDPVAMTRQLDMVIVGAGFAGLYMLHEARTLGLETEVIEAGDGVGGTWYWNRYPGAMCDTASLIYLPLLEETGHLPTEKYTHGPEILEHCRRIARHFDLYDDAVFSTEVTGLTWDAEHRQWVISTDRGDAMRARHVCVGTGPLHKAKLPGISGIGDFTGHSFHTSRWDYDYTGGDPEGSPMTGLADRRVGIIGTGATAVQCIPHLSRSSGELFVFIVDDPTTAEALKPWYRQLCKRPCFHDEYLDSYNRPNVHLIDTDGRGVERITERGLMVNGTEFELDCIIYASGFEVGTDFEKRWGFDPVGANGQSLSDAWAEGMSTLHGMHVNGFPNLFVIGPSQAANLISNIPHNLVEAGRTVAAIVAEAERRGAGTVEVTEEAEQAWVELLESGGRTFGGDPSCTPGYYNNEGRPIEGADRRGMLGYPDGPAEYFRYIETWRESGEFAGLVFD